ncbi:MAG TPA: hypothetical protein EYQ62_06905 [Verrucomicrobiales bacterium]|nr:hypothetical protein [Verrucomicrobiales bacterium]
MDWLHGILNLAGLLLWISWRTGTMPRSQPPRNLAGPTPRQGPVYRHSWIYLLVLLALLGGRAVFYNQFGPGLDWYPHLNLLDVFHPFKSDSLPHALAYSMLSFAHWLAALYFCLALLATVQPQTEATGQWREFLKAQFGWPGGLPVIAQWGGVIALAVGFRVAEANWIESLEAVTLPANHLPLLVLLDLRAAIYLIMVLLALYLLNSYVYFGEQAFWKTVNESGKRLLTPLRILPWETRKVDFAPIVALAIAYGLSLALTPSHLAAWLR